MIKFVVFFLISSAITYFFAEFNRTRGILGKDINKADQRILPESAGIALLFPLWLAIGITVLYIGFDINLIAFGLMVSIFGFVGYLDDSQHKLVGKTIPLLNRALPCLVAALAFSFTVEPGLNLLLFTIFILVLSMFQNTFAGLNGLEVGSGTIISFAIASLLIGTNYWLLAELFSVSILGLLVLNIFPARVLPGDSGTMIIGSALAGLIVLTGKTQLLFVSLLFFLPHFVDLVLLKFLTNKDDMTQIKQKPYELLEDGRLSIPKYKDKIRFDFAKLILKIFGPLKEWQVVAIMWLVVLVNSILVLNFFT